VTCREDPNENIFPRKERPENKIDPAAALFMAMGRALLPAAPEPRIRSLV
jgi:phage terminase large subunit-like protein